MSAYCVVLTTASNSKEAEKISKALVENRLAACVNIIPKIGSRYWWKGRVETSSECLLIVKTRKNLFRRLEKKVKAVHSYTLPEIIALPIQTGSKRYLDWIDQI